MHAQLGEHDGGMMESSPTVPEYSQVSLKSLKLRAGMFLQTQRIQEKESPNYEAQFLGAIQDKCLMVVPVGLFSIKTGMRTGEMFVIRGFTGLYDFHFTSTVLQAVDFTYKEPSYAYAVLSFPEAVEARKVRNSMRIKTSLPASATPDGSDTPRPVTLVDLSVDGSLVRAQSALGAIGDLMHLDFSIASDMGLAHLGTPARICHSHAEPSDDHVLIGLLFENMSAAYRVMLQAFVLSNLE